METTTTYAKDLDSVLKASQAIASEIQQKPLLETLMKIVLENACAQQGFLLLEKDGEWFIEAEGMKEIDEVLVLRSIPLHQSVISQLSVPITLIEYVIRTQERVVLHDAAQEGQFTDDPHIVQNQTKSALGLPLLNQGKLTGLLYLENNFTTGVFTPERLEVLNLLSLQIVMSIQNARVYQQMWDQNIAYEKRIAELEHLRSSTTD
jgi:GAF domain-containing protein